MNDKQCIHYWRIASFPRHGLYPARCLSCKAKTTFPLITQENIEAFKRHPGRKATSVK